MNIFEQDEWLQKIQKSQYKRSEFLQGVKYEHLHTKQYFILIYCNYFKIILNRMHVLIPS